MPQQRGITVHVTDLDGKTFEEWGVQKLRNHKVSAYVKSTAGQPFRVSIQPDIPYLDQDQPELSNENQVAALDTAKNRKVHAGRRNFSDQYNVSAPPFSFVAALYLDGRTKPERRLTVYLDPMDTDFEDLNCVYTFKGRCERTRNGRLKEKGWVFKDVGIETVFNKIGLNTQLDDGRSEDPEENIVEAMSSSAICHEQTEMDYEEGKPGQIIVKLERVQLRGTYNDPNYNPIHQEGEEDDIDMAVQASLSHTTATTHRRTLKSRTMRCERYSEYIQGEGTWATFQFFYRSQEQLEKFEFPDFPKNEIFVKRQPRSHRFLDDTLSNLTPLSISHPSRSAPSSAKRKEIVIHERGKNGKLENQGHKPKFDFGSLQGNKNDLRNHLTKGHGGNGKTLLQKTPKKGKLRIIDTKPDAPSDGSSAEGSLFGESSTEATDQIDVQPPPNSPTETTPQISIETKASPQQRSNTGTWKLLSDASSSLEEITKAQSYEEERAAGRVSTTDRRYRQQNTASDADDENEIESDSEYHTADGIEEGGSDKENVLSSIDKDDGGLHEEFKAVTLGKRQRGEEAEAEAGKTQDRIASSGSSQGRRAVSPVSEAVFRLPGLNGLDMVDKAAGRDPWRVRSSRRSA